MTGFAEAGMVHLRLIVPADDAGDVLQALEQSPAVVNLVRGARKPRSFVPQSRLGRVV